MPDMLPRNLPIEGWHELAGPMLPSVYDQPPENSDLATVKGVVFIFGQSSCLSSEAQSCTEEELCMERTVLLVDSGRYVYLNIRIMYQKCA
jgi:hypothetical protein